MAKRETRKESEVARAQRVLQEAEQKKVDAFRDAYTALCQEHGMAIESYAVARIVALPKQ